ncbi:MAG: TonB-dependent receptor [Bacteroidota bacterium]|nr:TonB-dependent receptor [Bacteroidota bacterium]
MPFFTFQLWLNSATIIFFSSLLVSPSFAQENVSVEELQEIVVSDTRLPSQPLGKHEIPAKITVITAKDIVESQAKTLQEAVQESAGVIFYDAKGNNFEQEIELRGYNAEAGSATAVFLDGVRINEPDFGSQNLALVPLESIERIEIVPGPSTIYGQYALAGVVNLVTKKAGDQTRVNFDVMGGSYARFKETLSIDGPLKFGPDILSNKTRYLMTLSKETDDQYRENAGSRLTKIFGKFSISPTDFTDIAVTYTHTKSTLGQAGANLSLSQYAANRRQDASPKDFYANNYNFLTVSINNKLPHNFLLNGNAFYRMLRQRRHTTSSSGSVNDNYYKAESKGGAWQLNQKNSSGALPFTWTLANEYRRDAFNTNDGTDSPKEQDSIAVSAQGSLKLFSKFTLTSGIRYDHTQMNYKDFSGSNPNAYNRFSRTTLRSGLSYQYSPTSSIYTSYSEGFRPPSVDEMFAQGSGFNNPDLKPVTSQNYEIGVKETIGKTKIDIAGFWTETRDEIFGTCTVCIWGEQDYDWKNRNVDSTRRRGIEATAKTRLTNHISATLNYAFTEALFTTNVKFATDRNIQKGDSIELVPKHKLDMTVTLKPEGIFQNDFLNRFTVSISALYRSTKFILDDEANTKPRIPGYLLGNLAIRYTHPLAIGSLNTFVKIENFGDTEYYNYSLLSSGTRFVGAQPTRQIFFGMSFALL